MNSSRFPGKPLASLRGRPMIAHVYQRASECADLDEVVIATCDAEIAAAAASFGAPAVMTSAVHDRATDRVAEVSARDPAEIVVMIQGDEPMIRGEMIGAVIESLRGQRRAGCVNLAAPIRSEAELLDPNTIKIATTPGGGALLFSRSPIPHQGSRPFRPGGWLKQVCVMAFRRSALQQFAALPQGPLEVAESIDMLRFLENEIPVQIVQTGVITHAVDTPADLALVSGLL